MTPRIIYLLAQMVEVNHVMTYEEKIDTLYELMATAQNGMDLPEAKPSYGSFAETATKIDTIIAGVREQEEKHELERWEQQDEKYRTMRGY